ncbi:MAG TPA: WD40 repeat domain-containing protein, partial [Aggregatilineaceae bacterium]|nr:WD40 repeat domain-containing protein [Aggregatilineaceae bacterium]
MQNANANTTHHAVQCPNCGGTMTLEFRGELRDKQAICKFCATTFDVPDSFARVTKRQTRRKGLFRGTETIEEVTEMRSDHPLQTPQSPPTLNIPTTPAVQTSSKGACLGFVILLVSVLGIIGGILAAVIPTTEINKLVDQIENSVGATSSQEIAAAREFKGMSISADTMLYSPDGKFLVAACTLNMITWDVQSGASIAEVDDTYTIMPLAFTPDGSQLITQVSSNLVIYDPLTAQPIRTIEGRWRMLALSPDQQTFAGLTYEGEITLYSLATAQPIRTLDTGVDYLQKMVFSPDGKYVVGGGSGSELYVWDVNAGARLFKGNVNASSVSALAFHPTRNLLVVGNGEVLEFYEIDEHGFRFQKTQTLPDSLMFSVEDLIFSPDGKELAIGNFFGGLILWDYEASEITHTLTNDYGIRAQAYSPDGSTLMGASSFGTVYEWQIREPSQVPNKEAAVQPPSPPAATSTPTPTAASEVDAPPTVVCQISPSAGTVRV